MENLIVAVSADIASEVAAPRSTARRSRLDDILARYRRQRIRALAMLIVATLLLAILWST